MTTPIAAPALWGLLQSWAVPVRPLAGEEAGALAALSQASFREAVLEAVAASHAQAAEPASATPEETSPAPAATPGERAATTSAPGLEAWAAPAREGEAIAREARRTGVDPALLAALRRAENGGPGREFGVLSVQAPSLEDQARVAANTIRKTVARFARQGGRVVDPATGRYTEAFLRFFSARYAPPAAGNDPLGLNRFHAENLIAVYRKTRDGNSQS